MLRHPKRWIRAVTAGIVLCLLIGTLSVYGQAGGVRRQVVRLHVLAHSDTTADQVVKLQVRDAVAAVTADWLAEVTDPTEALTLLRRHLPEIEAVARQTVREAGYSYPVAAHIHRSYFTTRQYDTVTLPAGMYQAVQVTLGDGKGQNWWCVVYPPMCAGAAIDRDALTQLMDPDTDRPTYQVKYKIVEWVESWLQLFRPIPK